MQSDLVGFELSRQQKFLLDRDGCDSPGRTVQLAIQLAGPLNPDRLKIALQRTVQRHEILRTTYKRSSGMRFPVQIVSGATALSWEQTDWASLNPDEQARSMAAWSNENTDLTGSVSFRALLVRASESLSILTIEIPALSADRATLQNLVAELAQLYAGPESTADEPLQYADYAQWQAELLTSAQPQDAASKAYWTGQDWAAAPPLTPPFAKKPAPHAAGSQRVLNVEARPTLFQELDASNVALDTVLLSVWQVLLWRLTRQASFTLGLATPGRNQQELESAFGLFARTLPLRAQLDPDQCFSEFARTVQAAKIQAEQSAEYLDTLNSAPARLRVGFSVQIAFRELTSDGVTFAAVPEQCAPNDFDLELRCTLSDEAAALQLACDPACFWSDGPERIGQALTVALNAVAANPNLPLGEIPLLEESDCRRIALGLNPTIAPYSNGQSIHRLFEQAAALKPEQPALRCGDAALSYAELNRRANRVAHLLRRHGVAANVPVGLCTERSLEMVVGLLAILKAGGCYVPLPSDAPNKRLLFQLAETKARLTLTQEKFIPLLEGAEGELIPLDGDAAGFDAESPQNPAWSTSPDDLAYIIYTSGSTGAPKGVAVRHGALVNYSEFICRLVKADEFPEGLSFATVSTVAADLGNTSIFPSLISGGCLHVVPYETTISASLFSEYLDRYPVDVLKITPSHFAALLDRSLADHLHGRRVWPQRYLFLGGEALSWNLLFRIKSVAPCAVFNHYGPTEATVGCCTFDANEDVSIWTPATVPVGRPIANAAIYILDERHRPVPVGVAGELCIGGAGLAEGYFNQPEQTQARFVSRTLADVQTRLYHSGDLARFLPNGTIEFLGRIDQQVKIRGFRVEPVEIETALARHPEVHQAVVLPFESVGGLELAAYVVSATAPGSAELRRFLAQSLPKYMLPAEFVLLPRMPLTPNGKLDQAVLAQARKDAIQDIPQQTESPRTPEEEKLAAIWSEVLKRPCSDIHADFFLLGGHSLLAAQIVARIRDIFKVQFPLWSFLQSPTIAQLAPKIAACPPVDREDQLEEFLATLQNLSEEEAERLLAEMERR